MKKGQKDVLYSNKKADMQMAPNTTFGFPISLNGKEMEPGKYTLDVVAEGAKEKWHFTEDFEINREEAKKYNKQDVTIEKKDYTWLYILIGILIILVVIIIILVKRKMDKQKRETAELREQLTQQKNTPPDSKETKPNQDK